jgi:uncharacterized protein
MLIPTLIMGVLAVALLWIGYRQGEGQHVEGLRITLNLTLQILPLLIFAFIVAGMIQVLLPQESVARWVGGESGMRGIFIGSFAGALAPGGPYVSMPIAASLAGTGASVGTVVAFLTGWSLWSLNRIPMEVGILGWRLTIARAVSTLIFPPLAGMIAQMIFGNGR